MNKLKVLNIDGIFIYGSFSNKDLFDIKHSDIDVIVFSSNYDKINKDDLIKKILDLDYIFLEKKL